MSRFPAAYARWREAEAALGSRRLRLARQRLSALMTAHATAVDLRARPLREDIEALARRARIALAVPACGAASGPRGTTSGLTKREADVLQLLGDGLTNREIGARLFISEKTVRTHVGHIFEKPGVHSRVEAGWGGARAIGDMEGVRWLPPLRAEVRQSTLGLGTVQPGAPAEFADVEAWRQRDAG